MSLFEIIIALVVFGVFLLVVNKFIPMDAMVKKILNIVAIVGLIVWLAYEFGLFDYLKRVKV